MHQSCRYFFLFTGRVACYSVMNATERIFMKPIPRTLFVSILSFFCLLNVSYLLSVEPDNDAYDYTGFDRSLIEPGETLVYNAYIFGQLIPMGTAELTISEEDIEGTRYYLFHGKARGGHLIFTVDLDLQSYVNHATLRPDFFIYQQTGFEQRVRRLDFDWEHGEIIYKKKSCPEDEYELRAQTPMLPQTRDILSTLYFARSIEPRVGATRVMRLIEKRTIWTVDVTVTEKKQITIADGKTFDALLVKIQPRQTGDNELFRGLFGLKGDIMLWVTEDKRIPVQIEGDYTLGFFNIKLRVMLQDWSPDGIVPSFIPDND